MPFGSLRPWGSKSPFGSLTGVSPPPANRPTCLREAIFYLLSHNNELTADRIHPNGLPQNPVYPAITTLWIGGWDGRNYAGRSHSSNRLRIACWAQSPEDLTALSLAVKSALTDYSGWVGLVHIADCWLVNEIDLQITPSGGKSTWLCQTILDFQIISQE